ncbi:hypothetical protein ACFQ1L_29770 [Phytohabitans flavus]|uniref:hypothetical protein n=1 Tax=Phytohabitans flavus TaxID=1076124 RepID=UPI003627BFB6
MWDRATVARCLPDRWILYAFRGDSDPVVHIGRDIPRDLPIAPGPRDPAPNLADPDRPVFPPSIAWMVDFEAAVQVGMAMRVPVEDDDGYGLLIVVGATAETGAQGAARLATLLEAHHYTGGLGLLAQGTPTNNTDVAGSGYSSADRDHAASRARERGGLAAPAPGSDAARLAGALGINPAVFAAAEGAGLREALDAQAMNAALWPATWGWFLRRLVPIANDATLEAVRRHFVDWVRARGPLPTLRVGTQPYGVVPTVAMAQFQPDAGPVEGPLHNVLTWLRHEWMRTTGRDDEIPDILRRRPVSDGYAVRAQFSSEWLPTAEGFMGLTDEQVEDKVTAYTADLANVRTLVGQIWRPEVFAPLAGVFQLPDAWPGVPPTVGTDLDPAAPAAWLAALLARLRERLPQDPELDWTGRPADSLLYLLLRHAARLVASGPAPALVPLPPRGGVGDPDGPALSAYQEFISSVDHLAARPSAAVDRAARETLDLASHRLDAWATSIATRRLAARRAATAGVAVGGYGFVQGLERATETVVDPGARPPLLSRANNAGYLHAPSVPQAVTAAVLRAGHLAHGGETSDTGTTPFALDLASTRVRLADQLLEGMRQGQSLSALLGYRFERGLEESDLARYRPDFRRLAPSAADGTDPTGEVADGVRLLELYHAGAIPWGSDGLPAAGTVAGLLGQVTEALDAVGDAAVAEGVHHALQGNHHRAAAALAIGTLDQGPRRSWSSFARRVPAPRSRTGCCCRSPRRRPAADGVPVPGSGPSRRSPRGSPRCCPRRTSCAPTSSCGTRAGRWRRYSRSRSTTWTRSRARWTCSPTRRARPTWPAGSAGTCSRRGAARSRWVRTRPRGCCPRRPHRWPRARCTWPTSWSCWKRSPPRCAPPGRHTPPTSTHRCPHRTTIAWN